MAALARAGTRLVFGVPGGGPNLDVVGAAEAAGLRFVLAHGETAATIMAATSADLTGAPGAVVVTRGPGLASAVNGIAHAALDRLPVVVIADTVADTRISHQRIDQAALGRSVAKAAFTVGGPPAAAAAVAGRAVASALTAPAGPVIANMDDGAADKGGPPWVENGVEAQTRWAAEDAAGRAGRAILAEAVRGARRPVVLLGTGAIPRTAAVRDALGGRGIPALHTYRARGVLPDSGAEAAGLVTGGTMEWPLLSAADLIVGLGVDEAEMIPARWDYAARTILVSEPGAPPAHGWFTGATELTMPIDDALGVLAAGPGGTMEWPPDAGRAAKTDAARRLAAAATAAPGRLAPQQVVATARACAPPETIATVDAGAHMLVAMPLWEVAQPENAADLQRPGHHGLRAARRDRRRPLPAANTEGAGARVHRRRRAGHDAGRDRDRGAAVAAGHRDRLQRRRAQPDRDQAEPGRPRRRGGGPVPPDLVRRRRGRDGRGGRRGEPASGNWPRR